MILEVYSASLCLLFPFKLKCKQIFFLGHIRLYVAKRCRGVKIKRISQPWQNVACAEEQNTAIVLTVGVEVSHSGL